MSVDQTSQLLQLILNSSLMVMACIILIAGLSMRHSAVGQELYNLHRTYCELSKSQDGQAKEPAPCVAEDRPSAHSLTRLKAHVQPLRQRYRTLHVALLWLYYALSTFVASTFTLALRSGVNWNGLIQVALAFFVSGLVLLWAGAALVLWDMHRSPTSLWDELNGYSSLTEKKPRIKPTPVKRSATPRSAQKALKVAE